MRELFGHGHEVMVQACEGSAIGDAAYEAQGATIVPDAESVFSEAELIVKVEGPADRGGAFAPGPHAVHLPAPRAGP